MNLENVKEKTRVIIKDFVNAIGLDGNEYSQINQTPIFWDDKLESATGEYITPESPIMQEYLDRKDFDIKTKKELNETGVIIVNSKYSNREEISKNLIITIIHETIHANRNVLAYDTFDDGENQWSYVYKNKHLQQFEKKHSFEQGDPSQQMLKGSIDTADKKAESSYYDINDIANDRVIEDKMEKQKTVDEALVEIMAGTAVDMYIDKAKGNNPEIWNSIKKYRDKCEELYKTKNSKYRKEQYIMCDIILKHRDFELFYWMLDPIMYANGDLHYDVFEKYTKQDKELVDKFFAPIEPKKEEKPAYMIGGINIFDIKNSKFRNDEEEER